MVTASALRMWMATARPDLLTPNGWFKNIDADHDKWEWHPDWKLGDAGFPILGYDVNDDGKMDIIYGQGHSYGLYWLEQQGDRAHPTWVKHAIDESFSQIHALLLADIDGDGQPELITGKRYRGHGGTTPDRMTRWWSITTKSIPRGSSRGIPSR